MTIQEKKEELMRYYIDDLTPQDLMKYAKLGIRHSINSHPDIMIEYLYRTYLYERNNC